MAAAAADSRALLQLLDQHYPGQQLKAVFNTHWHWDQTGFNATARERGVDVFAHENTRLWLSTTVNSRWEHRIYKPQPAAALPNRTFYYDPQEYEFGGTKVQYVHLDPAHTDGDIYVRFPEENLIAVGGVLTPGRYPIIDDATNGWLGGINGALYALNEVGDESTRLVPATGPVAGMADLKLQMDMGVDVMTQMAEVYRKGGTFEDFLALNPTSKYDAHFGDPAQFLKLAFDSAWYQVSSFGGLSTGLPRTRGRFGPPPARGKAK